MGHNLYWVPAPQPRHSAKRAAMVEHQPPVILVGNHGKRCS
jgi:hypothetical protein